MSQRGSRPWRSPSKTRRARTQPRAMSTGLTAASAALAGATAAATTAGSAPPPPAAAAPPDGAVALCRASRSHSCDCRCQYQWEVIQDSSFGSPWCAVVPLGGCRVCGDAPFSTDASKHVCMCTQWHTHARGAPCKRRTRAMARVSTGAALGAVTPSIPFDHDSSSANMSAIHPRHAGSCASKRVPFTRSHSLQYWPRIQHAAVAVAWPASRERSPPPLRHSPPRVQCLCAMNVSAPTTSRLFH
ncbi:MAG: hypothetical protein J3K34DRAFT_413643 [Monoraphidium minutum]|nr:MAG: hypothetical protein J3K34DRAFT_413643 [Monoraphidium minutum]